MDCNKCKEICFLYDQLCDNFLQLELHYKNLKANDDSKILELMSEQDNFLDREDKLIKELTKIKKTNLDLIEKLKEKEDSLKNLEIQNEKLEDDLSALKKRNVVYQLREINDSNQILDNKENLEENLELQEAQNNELKIKLEFLKSRNKELSTKYTAAEQLMEEERREYYKQIDELKSRTKFLEKSQMEITDEKDYLTNEIEIVKSCLSKAKSGLENKELNLIRIRNLNKKKNEQISNLKTKIDKMPLKKLKIKIRNLNKNLANLKQENCQIKELHAINQIESNIRIFKNKKSDHTNQVKSNSKFFGLKEKILNNNL